MINGHNRERLLRGNLSRRMITSDPSCIPILHRTVPSFEGSVTITRNDPAAELLRRAYLGRTVLVTGHTGFKGAWLTEWLLVLGARVVGVALPPPDGEALFNLLRLRERIEHHDLDVRDGDRLKEIVHAAAPDYVFHLAAQSL